MIRGPWRVTLRLSEWVTAAVNHCGLRSICNSIVAAFHSEVAIPCCLNRNDRRVWLIMGRCRSKRETWFQRYLLITTRSKWSKLLKQKFLMVSVFVIDPLVIVWRFCMGILLIPYYVRGQGYVNYVDIAALVVPICILSTLLVFN